MLRTLLRSSAALAIAFSGCSKDEPSASDEKEAVPAPAPSPSAELSGEDIYRRYCVVCHQDDGSGKNGMTGASFVGDASPLEKDDDELVRAVQKGITGGPVVMPPHEDLLTEEQILATIAYIRGRFGSQAKAD